MFNFDITIGYWIKSVSINTINTTRWLVKVMSECFRQKCVQEQSYYIHNYIAFLKKIKEGRTGFYIEISLITKIFGKKKDFFVILKHFHVYKRFLF